MQSEFLRCCFFAFAFFLFSFPHILVCGNPCNSFVRKSTRVANHLNTIHGHIACAVQVDIRKSDLIHTAGRNEGGINAVTWLFLFRSRELSR